MFVMKFRIEYVCKDLFCIRVFHIQGNGMDFEEEFTQLKNYLHSKKILINY